MWGRNCPYLPTYLLTYHTDATTDLVPGGSSRSAAPHASGLPAASFAKPERESRRLRTWTEPPTSDASGSRSSRRLCVCARVTMQQLSPTLSSPLCSPRHASHRTHGGRLQRSACSAVQRRAVRYPILVLSTWAHAWTWAWAWESRSGLGDGVARRADVDEALTRCLVIGEEGRGEQRRAEERRRPESRGDESRAPRSPVAVARQLAPAPALHLQSCLSASLSWDG